MNDRELLEMAAKAAGFEKIDYSNFAGMDVRYGFSEAVWNGDSYWNPLTDDGDALRLAVNLNIHVDPTECGCNVFLHFKDAEEEYGVIHISEDGNKYVATRRAIVRAAAEIGKTMP